MEPKHQATPNAAQRTQMLVRLLVYLLTFGGVPLALIITVSAGRAPDGWSMPLLMSAIVWMVVTKIGFGNWVQTGTFGPSLHTPDLVLDWRRGDYGRALWGQGRVSDVVGVAVLAGAIIFGWLALTDEAVGFFVAAVLAAAVIVIGGRVIGAKYRRGASADGEDLAG